MSHEQRDNQTSLQQPVPAQPSRDFQSLDNPVVVSVEPGSSSKTAAPAMTPPPAAAAVAASAEDASMQHTPAHLDIVPLLSSYRNFIKEQEASGDSTRFPEQQQDASTQQQHASQAGPLLSSSSQEKSQQLQQQDDQGGPGRGARSTRFGAGKRKKKKVHSSTRTRVRLTDLTSRHQVRQDKQT